MKKKLISIVVPSYNAEKYLNKGVRTFLHESLLDKIEIIIVNDGSIDHTAKIAERLKKQYPKTITVVHKENGGHGSTINKGIDIARGKYFCVVDADDWVHTDSLIKLVDFLKDSDSDLILTNCSIVDPAGNVTGHKMVPALPEGKTVNINDYLLKIKNVEMHNYCILYYYSVIQNVMSITFMLIKNM